MDETRAHTSEIGFIVALVVGLACMDTWPDMLGHCAGLASANDSLANAGLNARFFWSGGLCAASLLIAALPTLARGLDKPLAVAVPLIGLACTALYAWNAFSGDETVLVAALAAMTAAGYAWFEVRLISLAGSAARFSAVVLVLAASRVAKMVLVTLTAALPEAVQIAATCASPIITGASVVVAAFCAKHVQAGAVLTSMAELPFARSSALSDTRTATVFLVACSVLSAVARSVSDLGFWGRENVIGSEYVAFVLPVGIALAVLVYVAFFRLRESEMLSHLVVLFLLVLGGLFLQDATLLSFLGLPAVVGSQASIATELFSQFLFWVSMIAAMRMGGVAPYRAVGLGEGAMSASALLLGVALLGHVDMQGVVAAASAYGTLIVVWYLLHRTQRAQAALRTEDEGTADPLAAACKRLAQQRGLSPREAEVLLLLAQGRSRTFIQSELFLSDGTVKTHIRHIYQKLDVHSKQELISLVQSN